MDLTPFFVPGVIGVMSLFLFTLMAVTLYTHERKR